MRPRLLAPVAAAAVLSVLAASAVAGNGGVGTGGGGTGTGTDESHLFPLPAKHSYGDGYGAGRHHEGQDVFARCGTPLVAARGGVVRFKAFQGRAGNYVVIDGDGTDRDYAYMHLQSPALVDKGDHVVTGQRIGEVGDTGAASGCHLHFELWTGPGWYTGGSPFDPLPLLKAWDKFS